MTWFDQAQLAGYVGMFCNLWAAYLIARAQRTSALQWTLAWGADAAWIMFAVLSGQGAALLDVLVFLPVHAMGTWRYVKGVRG